MPDSLISDIGHITVPVKDMRVALAFYRDLLGFRVEGKEHPVWTVISVEGGQLTLYAQKEVQPVALGAGNEGTPFRFHVEDFQRAAKTLESRGVRVKRESDHSGVVWDPFGNVLGLHDHLGES